MLKTLLFTASLALFGCTVPVDGSGERSASARSPFSEARRVWPESLAKHMNLQVIFRAKFNLADGAKPFLRVAGSSVYRIRLNGAFIGHGPARGPKHMYRVDEWPLTAGAKTGENILEIEAAGYNVDSYQYFDQPSFIQAEVVDGGRVLAATHEDSGAFKAYRSDRLSKVSRYSFQRAFAESYRIGATDSRPYRLERRDAGHYRYLERIAPYPNFERNESVKVVSRAAVRLDLSREVKNFNFAGQMQTQPSRKGYRQEDFQSDMWRTLQSLEFTGRRAEDAAAFGTVVLPDGESVMLDAGLNDCGFAAMTVKVKKPGRLFLNFDEVLRDGAVDTRRTSCVNAIEWDFTAPGVYEVESIEPYVWRYANLSALGGDFEVSRFFIRAYKNPLVGRADFRCSDPRLVKVFNAARETFAQNAVDVFTDCPGRERAGWLCDSFFIGRVNKLLCGDARLEKLFLQNYQLPDRFECLPDGMVPMCWPSDHYNENFIPNWAMWLVIEVEEYLQRTGDREMVDALKPRLVALLEYMDRFRNSDGLLENLPKWVFVEWSRSNKLVQDVNYPSNMTWAEVLDIMARLYGMKDRAEEAARIRETVLKQSWTGKWFCDNAVRQSDGSLKLSGECTETCQYYAFFFKTATPESHPELWKTLVEDFGPRRAETKKHPEIAPSNAFIGNYLRLECLSRQGLSGKIYEETNGFFLYMAERTGTLWEMISPTASCSHGFASHAAVYLFRDILGVKSVDVSSRKVVVEIPSDIPLDWCEGTLPVSPTESVRVKWTRGGKPETEWLCDHSE